MRYLAIGDLVKKVRAYFDSEVSRDSLDETSTPIAEESKAVLDFLPGLFASLLSDGKKGRIILEQGDDQPGGVLSYHLIQPAIEFLPLLEDARSIIFAGGTMGDVAEFRDFLMPSVPLHAIHTFSCGHMVPRENMLTIFAGKDSQQRPIRVNFETRMRRETVLLGLHPTFRILLLIRFHRTLA